MTSWVAHGRIQVHGNSLNAGCDSAILLAIHRSLPYLAAGYVRVGAEEYNYTSRTSGMVPRFSYDECATGYTAKLESAKYTGAILQTSVVTPAIYCTLALLP